MWISSVVISSECKGTKGIHMFRPNVNRSALTPYNLKNK